MLKIKNINCDGNVVEHEWDNAEHFLSDMNSCDEEVSCKIPMLDDELVEVVINGEVVDNSNLEIVNDLYELLKEVKNY